MPPHRCGLNVQVSPRTDEWLAQHGVWGWAAAVSSCSRRVSLGVKSEKSSVDSVDVYGP